MKTLRYIVIILIVLSLGCQNQPPSDWSQYIKSSLWVPDKAKNIHFYRLAESYQVEYKVHECYPGKIFIQYIVSNMVKKGWKRLDHDFLNPTIKSNHAKFAGGLWDDYRDKDGYKVFQWIDDWKDSKNNYIRYGLKYQEKMEVSENSCNLKVVVIFIPAEAMK